ncbi:hypothetical protein MsAm2_11870 [Methanolapillus ohkumae]|uniref:Uncharacterized protein n=1 Tax=Methanolapillus ohkumae TaxID=3028298 RepID=A0AA96VJ54_9EURY|nr:hypothetical protein MsAm2_11870 [Methanosarcinaceae archaeon Am2]
MNNLKAGDVYFFSGYVLDILILYFFSDYVLDIPILYFFPIMF